MATTSADYTPLPVVQVDLTGRTVLVVGSNTGLGYEAAKHLARMNPKRLIGTCRTDEKCRATEESIKKETDFNAVECWPLELSSFSSVKAFVDRFERDGEGRLDIVLLNAGVAIFDYTVTEDGHETQVQINYLSSALLSLLLVPTMLRTAEKTGRFSRLALVSSRQHFRVSFDADNFPQTRSIVEVLDSEEYSTPENMSAKRYSQTKFLNILFTRALQAHLPSDAPLVMTSVCPAFCVSDLLRHVNKGQYDEALKSARSAEEGSRQLILGTVGPQDGKEETMKGGYVSDNAVRDPSPWTFTEEGKQVQERLWKETLEILSTVDARVTKAAEVYTKS
ncbi:hypothetical protein EIP91_004774 [Steccherinum ochraceum]|uniref:Uncharacterized protein n=1 Tax=Steccherinum ochraceum TaxID=92696 RepID=A0A4V2MVV4_9APHY|nr:hypothetical protein EIP91_004774 [Steccherinum ochraceum]